MSEETKMSIDETANDLMEHDKKTQAWLRREGESFRFDTEEEEQSAKLEYELNRNLSIVIGRVLRAYGVRGAYSFCVSKDPEYGHAPVTHLMGKKLSFPQYALGVGSATVENPDDITPL